MEKAPPTPMKQIELIFGATTGGRPVLEDLAPAPGVRYVKCKEGAVPNVTVFSTLGLSRFELASSTSDKTIPQELFTMFRDGEAPKNAQQYFIKS
jgi:hypothetical protein